VLQTLLEASRVSSHQLRLEGSRKLHRKPLDSTADRVSEVSILPDHRTDPDLSAQLPPRSDKEARRIQHRKSASQNIPLISFSNLQIKANENDDSSGPERKSSDSNVSFEGQERRKSWWGHRKSSSDGGGVEKFQLEDTSTQTQKNTQFKSYFAVPESENVLQSTNISNRSFFRLSYPRDPAYRQSLRIPALHLLQIPSRRLPRQSRHTHRRDHVI
jgi:hypothetical protein